MLNILCQRENSRYTALTKHLVNKLIEFKEESNRKSYPLRFADILFFSNERLLILWSCKCYLKPQNILLSSFLRVVCRISLHVSSRLLVLSAWEVLCPSVVSSKLEGQDSNLGWPSTKGLEMFEEKGLPMHWHQSVNCG